jgi:nucleoid DNA-binding protein
MDKYLVALLNNNLRVIIPDFGAFIIRQQEPKIVVFNEFLKYDDGLLLQYLIKTEAIEMDVARRLLSEYTGHATRALETGEAFTIAGLGELQKDRSGKIVFTAESVTSTRDKVQSSQEDTVIQLVDENSEPKPKPRPKPKLKEKTVPKAVSKNTQELPVSKVTETPPKVPEPITMTIEPEVNITPKIQTPVETLSTAIHSVVKDKQTGDRRIQIRKWVLILLLANIVILAFFIFRNNIRNVFKKNIEPIGIMDSVIKQLGDSVRAAAADTSLIFREASNDSSVIKNDSLKVNLRYYIVAGCFRDEINADELVRSLKKMGFNAEKFGKIGNLYAVSFVSFDDKELAVNELERIRKEIHPEAWMTRF